MVGESKSGRPIAIQLRRVQAVNGARVGPGNGMSVTSTRTADTATATYTSHVKYGSQPTLNSWDYRPFMEGNDEESRKTELIEDAPVA
jgi:hypothetical protein